MFIQYFLLERTCDTSRISTDSYIEQCSITNEIYRWKFINKSRANLKKTVVLEVKKTSAGAQPPHHRFSSYATTWDASIRRLWIIPIVQIASSSLIQIIFVRRRSLEQREVRVIWLHMYEESCVFFHSSWPRPSYDDGSRICIRFSPTTVLK